MQVSLSYFLLISNELGKIGLVLLFFKLVLTLFVSCFGVVSLVGQSAAPEMLQKLTYLVLRHNPQITRVDTVRAYTFGVLYFVEVSPSSLNAAID